MKRQAWRYVARWLGTRGAAAAILWWFGLIRAEWFVIGYTVCEVGWFWQIGETVRWQRTAQDALSRVHELQAAENRRVRQEDARKMSPPPHERIFLDRLSNSLRDELKRRYR
jgi:hypothetical protein